VLAKALTEIQLEALKQYDTCILADALETFGHRLRNEGYTRPGLRRMTGEQETVIGYAATARVRSSDPSVLGSSYVANYAWWPEINRALQPRIAVLEDLDPHPGAGACVGEVTAAILKSLHCVAAVTNGAVRDLQAVEALRFPLFASYVSPSHSYAHIVDHSHPVEICGLLIQPGDLLMVDCHGVISIPLDLAPALPAVAARLRDQRRIFVEFCQSANFSVDRVAEEVLKLRL